jgi:hypothetical protein
MQPRTLHQGTPSLLSSNNYLKPTAPALQGSAGNTSVDGWHARQAGADRCADCKGLHARLHQKQRGGTVEEHPLIPPATSKQVQASLLHVGAGGRARRTWMSVTRRVVQGPTPGGSRLPRRLRPTRRW